MGLLRNRPHLNAPPPEDQGGSDAKLVAQDKFGDARAFGLLYRLHINAVYDSTTHRLGHREDADGRYLTQWDGSKTALGKLQAPTGITVDNQGNIYIVDIARGLVAKFHLTPSVTPVASPTA